MTRQDFAFKWLLYAVALLPVLLLEFAVFSRWPLLGVSPVLVPVAAFTVAVLEGPTGGAGYGLFCALPAPEPAWLPAVFPVGSYGLGAVPGGSTAFFPCGHAAPAFEDCPA